MVYAKSIDNMTMTASLVFSEELPLLATKLNDYETRLALSWKISPQLISNYAG